MESRSCIRLRWRRLGAWLVLLWLAGCWPVLVQVPVFFALYKVLFVTIEMRHTPFYGWIHDLAAPDPTNIFNLFGLIPWTPPALLPVLGAWPVIMGSVLSGSGISIAPISAMPELPMAM